MEEVEGGKDLEICRIKFHRGVPGGKGFIRRQLKLLIALKQVFLDRSVST